MMVNPRRASRLKRNSTRVAAAGTWPQRTGSTLRASLRCRDFRNFIVGVAGNSRPSNREAGLLAAYCVRIDRDAGRSNSDA